MQRAWRFVRHPPRRQPRRAVEPAGRKRRHDAIADQLLLSRITGKDCSHCDTTFGVSGDCCVVRPATLARMLPVPTQRDSDRAAWCTVVRSRRQLQFSLVHESPPRAHDSNPMHRPRWSWASGKVCRRWSRASGDYSFVGVSVMSVLKLRRMTPSAGWDTPPVMKGQ